MKIVHWITGITLAALLTVACSSDRAGRRDDISDAEVRNGRASDVRQTVLVYRGYALYGHEVRSFRPCGEADPLWVNGPSGLLWTLHKRIASPQAPYQEVFAVVEGRKVPAPTDGFGADYPGALQIEAVLYAGLEGPGCHEDWSAFQYRVYGNEPFWSVEVSDRHMRLSRLGSDDRIWQEITVEHTSYGVRYTGIDTMINWMELTITREPCLDSMSGAYYAFAAMLRVEGEELHGCALQGQP